MQTKRLMTVGIVVLAMLGLAWTLPPSEPTQSVARLSPAGEVLPQATPQPTEEIGELEEMEEPGAPEKVLPSGLQTLDSFRSEMALSWNGTKAFEQEGGTKVDKQVEGFFNLKLAFVRQPPAYELHMESIGLEGMDPEKVTKISYVQVGDTGWMYQSGTESWMQIPAHDMSSAEFMQMTPAFLLPGLDTNIKAKGGASEQTINNVKCYNYTFTEKEIPQTEGLGKVNRASGEMCLAVEGDYIVNFSLVADIVTSEGEENPMFDKGSINMTYKVFDVNQPITIEPPAEALAQRGAREDIPMTADAKIDFSMPGMVSYKTALSVDEVTKFYETEMPKQGWKLAEHGKTTFEDWVSLTFTKGKDTASVMISKEEKGTNVMVSIQSE
ncbi:MAG: hypothetical protein NZ765_02640 [Anaerolineae bacterium]|nr:hypothetical protein [Anaerolineae bacterium]MDW8070435.1 hypothetical protein [Anaerolineae bacterium]